MAKKQLHIRIKEENHKLIMQKVKETGLTVSEVFDDMLTEDRVYSDLKKSLRWSNDMMEMVYEMVNYITLEMEYRLGKIYPPRFTSDEKSRIIERIEAKRKQERGYINARDRNQK